MINKFLIGLKTKEMILKEKLSEKNGSWFTENFAQIAIVVALAVVIIAALKVIFGDENSGLIKALGDKITSIFS